MLTSFNPAQSLLIDDFDSFVRYLEGKLNLSLTAGGGLKAADLWVINERVNYKAPDYVTNRSRQIDYLLLGFLFQVATASRLFLVKVEKGTVLTADTDRLDAYHNLTLEEKYVFLLETAWCYLDWSAIDGDGRSGQGANWFQDGIRQLLQNPVGTEATVFTRGWVMEGNPKTIHLSASSNVYIRAGHWSGWYDIREVSQPKRNKYELEIDRGHAERVGAGVPDGAGPRTVIPVLEQTRRELRLSWRGNRRTGRARSHQHLRRRTPNTA